jgi:hypothetical protein
LIAVVSLIRLLVCWIGDDKELLLDPDDVSDRELVFIGAEVPPALVMLAPVVKLLEVLGVAIPVLNDPDPLPLWYEPAPLPLLPLPSEPEAVLRVLEAGVTVEFPATLS